MAGDDDKKLSAVVPGATEPSASSADSPAPVAQPAVGSGTLNVPGVGDIGGDAHHVPGPMVQQPGEKTPTTSMRLGKLMGAIDNAKGEGSAAFQTAHAKVQIAKNMAHGKANKLIKAHGLNKELEQAHMALASLEAKQMAKLQMDAEELQAMGFRADGLDASISKNPRGSQTGNLLVMMPQGEARQYTDEENFNPTAARAALHLVETSCTKFDEERGVFAWRSIFHTPMWSLGQYGVGVQLYFNFLFALMFVFAGMGALIGEIPPGRRLARRLQPGPILILDFPLEMPQTQS